MGVYPVAVVARIAPNALDRPVLNEVVEQSSLSWSGASPDPASSPCSSASGTLGLRPRKGGTGRGDQGGINDRVLPHRHAPFAEVSLDDLKDLLSQAVLLEQVAEGQNRGLVRNPVADQIDAGKRLMVGTSIRATSMAGSLREYYC